MEKDYMAFFVYDGHNLINFIQVNKQFFVNYGHKLVIAPMNRICKIDLYKYNKIAELHFEGINGKGGILKLMLTHGQLMKQFVNRFISINKPQSWFERLCFFPHLSTSPEFYIIDLKSILNLKGFTKNKKIIEITIADDLLIEIKKDNYTKIYGFFVPVNYCVPLIQKTNKKHKEFKRFIIQAADRISSFPP